jgi:hypothetical protein
METQQISSNAPPIKEGDRISWNTTVSKVYRKEELTEDVLQKVQFCFFFLTLWKIAETSGVSVEYIKKRLHWK